MAPHLYLGLAFKHEDVIEVYDASGLSIEKEETE